MAWDAEALLAEAGQIHSAVLTSAGCCYQPALLLPAAQDWKAVESKAAYWQTVQHSRLVDSLL